MKVYHGVGRRTWTTTDVREPFADLIYGNAGGIRAHALALKIYNSDGAEEYAPEEVEVIRGVAERLCVPGFIDGLMEQLDNQKTNDNYGNDRRRETDDSACRA